MSVAKVGKKEKKKADIKDVMGWDGARLGTACPKAKIAVG
jgi:hypothetical protein